MTLDEYHGIHQSSAALNEDIGMSAMEKALACSLKRIEIRGKRGRTVPVLLTSAMSKALDLLIKCREAVGICQGNKFVFPTNTASGCIRGCDVLRHYAEVCGADHPDTLKSTNLRKHIATMTQIINLDPNELDILARFMGHDIRVHREYYRLPEETTQLAKVAKVLHALDGGVMSKLAGLRLDDIELDVDEEVEEGMSALILCQLTTLNVITCRDGL